MRMTYKSSILRIENFYSAHLDNQRDIYVYLPPSYQYEQTKGYPVLYMHDGQNIFHPAFNGYSWHLDQTIDRLIHNRQMEEIIVVGIPNMGLERSNEFTHDLEGVLYQDDKVPIEPKGHLYEKFIIDEVKSYIDSVFRTKSDSAHTALMGSSRGGQVTYHIGLRHPDVFSKLGIISPYFYCVDSISLEQIRLYHTFSEKQPLSQLWIDLGSSEGTLVMEKHVRAVTEELVNLGYEADNQLIYFYDHGAAHVEKDWAARLALPLIHFFGNKGEERSLSLNACEEVGIVGPKSRLNPILEFENDFKMSLLRATYHVEDQEIVEILADGTIMPKKTGLTSVTVKHQGLEATTTIHVVSEKQELVTLDLIVHVPPHTPVDMNIYAWFPLRYNPSNGTYYNRLQVPLDAEFIYQISRQDGMVEVNSAGEQVKHKYTALEDAVIEINVEDWRRNES
ncbi:alpha/beta hydrolase-fold protein [Paenibacillus sp. N1-5-1-14]|uniref:alpha/beta hydrolase n=1 Tax=Paenibacillus radicibacter TaxID=2972488 RepID=UPI00215957C6|nr:alpha/beta hydrolase-fold protein [Paenibacillus radicibacter]MCR8645382.1 alpha/beta hydrolase-fold protein [Paenibacillus radicibacter]